MFTQLSAAHAAGNLIGSLAIIAAVSYCGIFAVSGTAAVNTAVAKTSLPFGQVARLLSLVHGSDYMHCHLSTAHRALFLRFLCHSAWRPEHRRARPLLTGPHFSIRSGNSAYYPQCQVLHF